MASKKISELPSSSTIDGTELIEIVQTGANKKATLSDIMSAGASSLISPDGNTEVSVIDNQATVASHSGSNYASTTTTPTAITINVNNGTDTTEVIITKDGITVNGENLIKTTYPFTVSGTTVILANSNPAGAGYYLNGVKCWIGGAIVSIVGTTVTFDNDYTGAYFEAIY